MRRLSALLLCVIGVALLARGPVLAQDGDEPTPEPPPYTGVTVTTQDFSSFRAGPGFSFEPLYIVDPGITMPAIGRSADGEWVQVWQEGDHGWIAAWLLIWVGDLVSLPVDGVNPEPFVRRAVAEGITTRETPIYVREITPSDQVGTLPEGTYVELTGRLGSQGMYQLQIQHAGRLYWVGAWNIRITGGRERNLFDTAYLYPFGRLLGDLDQDIGSARRVLSQIEAAWRRLQEGGSVNCDALPVYVERDTSDSDVGAEPIFAPLVNALDAGVSDTNAAISLLADACGREDEDFYLTQQDVNAALKHIESAHRNLNLATSLLASLRHRDPLLGDEN